MVRVVAGPSTYTRPEHERVVEGPTKMISIPPRCYVVVSDPVLRDPASAAPLFDTHGMVRLKRGDLEIRTPEAFPDPFALFPGETLLGDVRKLRVVEVNQALKLRVTRDFKDADNVERKAGDEFLFHGPGTYIPRIEVEENDLIEAIVITHSQALRLRGRVRRALRMFANQRRTWGLSVAEFVRILTSGEFRNGVAILPGFGCGPFEDDRT